MKVIIVDLEMNAIKGCLNEIIQIGAVRLNESHDIVDEFVTYVKPVMHDIVPKTTRITGIVQEQVEHAPLLRDALLAYVMWAGEEYDVMYSWSTSDIDAIQNECGVKGIDEAPFRYMYEHWGDYQREFSELLGYNKPLKLPTALNALDMNLQGAQHDGLQDARNTAFLYKAAHDPKQAHFIQSLRDVLVPSEECTTNLGTLLSGKFTE